MHSATCIPIQALRAPAATGFVDGWWCRVGKVFLAMVTIFCLLLGAPFDADASSRFVSHAAVLVRKDHDAGSVVRGRLFTARP